MASTQPQVKTEPTSDAQNIITALGKAFKGQNGAPLTGDQLAQWLHQNMAQLSVLVKEGKLSQAQILAVRKPCRLLPLREFIFVPT
jgi:transcription initiation factor TFIID subunit 12